MRDEMARGRHDEGWEGSSEAIAPRSINISLLPYLGNDLMDAMAHLIEFCILIDPLKMVLAFPSFLSVFLNDSIVSRNALI